MRGIVESHHAIRVNLKRHQMEKKVFKIAGVNPVGYINNSECVLSIRNMEMCVL